LRIPLIVKAALILIVILAIWIGVGIFIYNQTNSPAQTTTTTPQTTTTTTTTTPASNLSPEEQAYIAKITDHSSRVIAAVTSLSELLSDPQIDDAAWVSQVTAQTETLQSLYDEIVQVSTPLSTYEIHYHYTFALGLYKSAAENIDQGIADQNIYSIQQAVSLINSGTSSINNAIDMLNNFIAENS
jgi:hypothetical protein